MESESTWRWEAASTQTAPPSSVRSFRRRSRALKSLSLFSNVNEKMNPTLGLILLAGEADVGPEVSLYGKWTNYWHPSNGKHGSCCRHPHLTPLPWPRIQQTWNIVIPVPQATCRICITDIPWLPEVAADLSAFLIGNSSPVQLLEQIRVDNYIIQGSALKSNAR